MSAFLPEERFLIVLRDAYGATTPGDVPALVSKVVDGALELGYDVNKLVEQLLLHQLQQSVDIRELGEKVVGYAGGLHDVLTHPDVPQHVKDEISERTVRSFIAKLVPPEALDRLNEIVESLDESDLGNLDALIAKANEAVANPAPEELEAYEDEIEALLRELGGRAS